MPGPVTTASTGSGDADGLPVFSASEVAEYLVSDFWDGYGGARSFDAVAGDTLYVDISDISDAGQTLARLALQAWSDASGLIFEEVTPFGPSPAGQETEDAPATAGTPYSLSVGEYFEGTLFEDGDRDRYGIAIAAGQTVTITLTGDDWNGQMLGDPELRIFGPDGALVAQNDDAIGLDSRVTFTADTEGTYYAEVAAFGDFYSGGYRLAVGDPVIEADIVFGDLDSGAYATFDATNGVIDSAFININSKWAGGGDRIDGYHFQTYLHEIGHALGLGHAGDYNGGASFGADNLYANDSWQMSVMSYFDQRENDFIGDSFAFVTTPQVADIVAVRELYGGGEVRTDDTVYGQNGTTGSYLDDVLGLALPTAMTILDDGGYDTLDLSGFLSSQRIDLTPGAHSDVAGLTGNLSIALDTIIESARTGGGFDWIGGNAADNHLDGGGAPDVLLGRDGDDTLIGGGGADYLNGGNGGNRIEGGDGGDLLIGGGVSDEAVLSILASGDDPLSDIWDDYADALF